MSARGWVHVLVGCLGMVTARGGGAVETVPASWRTPAEIADYQATPALDETVAFLRRVAAATPMVRLETFGTSAQGRGMSLVIVSAAGAFTPAAAAAGGKPIVLIQNGIHPGEIDGKDACLAILRDLALGRGAELFSKVTLLVVPILNVDGHERVSPYHRPNQDGPRDGMGFRTNASGLDLNRDHLKLEAPESAALVALVNRWRPHLHVDVHVTDGVDLDWVLTWASAEAPQAPPAIDAWRVAHLPHVVAATARAGHRVGPYVDLVDRNDPGKGFSSIVGGGRYSTGYFPLRNRLSVLIETHSYKPYEQRVLATRDFLLALLAEVARDGSALPAAVSADERRTVALGAPAAPPSELVLDWRDDPHPDTIALPAYDWASEPAVVTGGTVLRYRRGVVRELSVPWTHRLVPLTTTPRPRGYLVLPGWHQIERCLAGHGLAARRLLAASELDVEVLTVTSPTFAPRPYQGLTRVEGTVTRRTERRLVPAGTLWVGADQPDFEVAAQLLEPGCPESLFQWGELSTTLEQKEYIDSRNLETIARDMLKDPVVAREWVEALKDPRLAGDARARSAWWYHRTPYWTVQGVGEMPVLRVMTAVTLATASWP